MIKHKKTLNLSVCPSVFLHLLLGKREKLPKCFSHVAKHFDEHSKSLFLTIQANHLHTLFFCIWITIICLKHGCIRSGSKSTYRSGSKFKLSCMSATVISVLLQGLLPNQVCFTVWGHMFGGFYPDVCRGGCSLTRLAPFTQYRVRFVRTYSGLFTLAHAKHLVYSKG